MSAARVEPAKTPATIVAAVLVVATIKLGIPSSPTARDFEECAEWTRRMFPGAERVARIMDCGAHFAGRRKEGGGYTYYDLLQNRSFDIAGPNPTANERGLIYAAYRRSLDLERRETALAEIQQLAVEEPRIVASSTPIDLRRPTPRLSKLNPCMIKGSLSCTWAKFGFAVRNAFASGKSRPEAAANSP